MHFKIGQKSNIQRNLTQYVCRLVLAMTLTNICLSSCGTWAGNPKDPDEEPTSSGGDSKVALDIQGLPTDTNLVATPVVVFNKDGTKAGSIALTDARLCLKEIKIKASDSDAKAREKFEGPFIVDLLHHQIAPSISEISLESGIYRNIELKLAKLEKDKLGGEIDEHDPMVEKSIILAGLFTPLVGNAKELSLALELDEEFQLKLSGSRSGINVSSDQLNTVIIGFGLYHWFDFSGQEWDFSDVKTDTIIIDHDSKSEQAKKISEYIKENIKDSAEFAKDKDHDGKISDRDDEEDEIREREIN